MVAIGAGIRTGFKVLQKIDRKYNINKIFVEKYVPPGYRKTVNRIFDYGLTTAGAISLWEYLNNDQTFQPGNNAPIQPRNGFKTGTPYKTRYRQSTRYGSRNPTRCYPNFQRRRSSPRKYYRS